MRESERQRDRERERGRARARGRGRGREREREIERKQKHAYRRGHMGARDASQEDADQNQCPAKAFSVSAVHHLTKI